MVPQKTQAVLEGMRKLMLSTKNFAEYRESLHMANPPCIPFFGKSNVAERTGAKCFSQSYYRCLLDGSHIH